MIPGVISADCLLPDTVHAEEGQGNAQPHKHATCSRATDGQRSAQTLRHLHHVRQSPVQPGQVPPAGQPQRAAQLCRIAGPLSDTLMVTASAR